LNANTAKENSTSEPLIATLAGAKNSTPKRSFKRKSRPQRQPKHWVPNKTHNSSKSL